MAGAGGDRRLLRRPAAAAELTRGPDIPYCESVRDFPTRDLLSGILRDEEEHVDFIETQFALIARVGIQSWIQLNSDPTSDD
jgi:bacterioferritin (cytochrome b1)